MMRCNECNATTPGQEISPGAFSAKCRNCFEAGKSADAPSTPSPRPRRRARHKKVAKKRRRSTV